MRVDQETAPVSQAAEPAWIKRAVAATEMWMVFVASAAAVFVALGATAGVAYASSWVMHGAGR